MLFARVATKESCFAPLDVVGSVVQELRGECAGKVVHVVIQRCGQGGGTPRECKRQAHEEEEARLRLHLLPDYLDNHYSQNVFLYIGGGSSGDLAPRLFLSMIPKY